MKINITFTKDELLALQEMNEGNSYTEEIRVQAMNLINQIIDANRNGAISKVTIEG